MKQSILSKCFAKMKRVALALFAALCVGSVWAEDGEVTYITTPMADPSAGYIRTGLGLYGKEVAVVFTNHTAQATWTVPYNLNNVEFLVVGGGGGGGADARSGDASTGGGGGGGGGVVTGLVNFVQGECLTIKVGAGGQGGTPGQSPSNWSGHYGASYGGEASQFSINDLEMYVKANGGGRDQGVSSNGSTYKNYTYYQGGVGGSNAGSRGNCKTEQSNANAGEKIDTANRLVAIDLTLANKGGNGESGSIDYYGYPAAGGGGGALTPGCDGESHWQGNWNEQNYWRGGDGGEGLASLITGELRVYGSGGGGASTQGGNIASGGDGAGNGGSDDNGGQGANALANQGGGGGGSSRTVAKGGNGGSGIVVLRYRAPIVEEDVRKLIKDYEWTGSEISLLAETDLYTVEGDIAKTDVGEYTVTVTLKEGWNWDDGSNGSKNYSWKIITATNEWTTAPSISKESWKYNDNAPGVLENNIEAKFGIDTLTVTYKKNGEVVEYSDDLFTQVGQYEVIYNILAGENKSYTELVTTISYTVEKLDNEWTTAPSISATSWIVGGTEKISLTSVDDLATKYPGQISVMISKDGAELGEFSGTLPIEAGKYTLTYSVPAGVQDSNIYDDFTYTLDFTINTPVRESLPESTGYKLLGLGVNNDEVAVVFTKSSSKWKPPVKIDGAQFLVVGGGGGGGADCHDDAASGGAGGGGGGVVTGEVDLTKDAAVTVTVGAGGAGGTMRTSERNGASSGNYYGASKKGGNSVLAVNKTTYVTAYGGGRDQGTDKRDTASITTANMREGGQGGSNGGSRGGITADQSKNPTKGAVASNAALRNCTTYGNKGGKGCSEYYYGYPAAGGGGGATEAGGDAGNNSTNDAEKWPGGKGGEGLASWITGNRVVYGSGGGGASTQGSSGGLGGEGAGNGGDRSERTGYGQGTSAVANQGGGGGGTSREISRGGNGGSGIVVIRYKTTIHTVTLPVIPNATWYNGANSVTEFKVEEGTTISLTLKAADGYFFENGTGEMDFNIGQNGTDGQTPQYLPAVAKIGEVKYSLLSAALDNAVAGAEIELVADIEVVEVIEVPNGVTLNLNGKTFKGDALGAVAVNKGTYVTPQNYKMVGPDADYYKSENAVLTIGATSITLNSGSLEVVPDEWWTLPGQTLTITEGAEFIIPEGKKMNNNGSTVVINGTLSGEGAINLYSLDATVQGAEGLKVTTTVDGYKVQYADGVYTLVKSELDVTIGDDTFDTVEELIAAANTTKTMTVTGNDWSAEGNVLKKGDDAYVTFADYYTVVVNGSTVTLTLNDTVKPVIGDSTEGADDAFTVSAEEVTIKITNYNSALKYGVRSAADIKGLDSATIQPVNVDNGEMTVQKSGDSQFYKVVVSDVDFSQAK